MTLNHFVQLDKNAQRTCVLMEGTFLDERQTQRHDVMLYEMDGFYVEAYFVKNTNKLAFLKSFTDPVHLDPYLEQINLQGLLEHISL